MLSSRYHEIQDEMVEIIKDPRGPDGTMSRRQAARYRELTDQMREVQAQLASPLHRLESRSRVRSRFAPPSERKGADLLDAAADKLDHDPDAVAELIGKAATEYRDVDFGLYADLAKFARDTDPGDRRETSLTG